MKHPETVITLFRHNRWANLRLLERCAELTAEQLQATVPGAFGSIRDTLQHIVTSEESYLYRIRTGQPLASTGKQPESTIAELIALAQVTGAGLIEWAPKVQPGDTVQVSWQDDTMRAVPKTIILTQVINHATEHRAQIMAIMTDLGVEPPDLQSWAYFDELA